MTSSYGFNFFFPTLVQGLGIGSSTVSLLLTATPYFLGALVSFLVAWNSDRIKERGWHISGGLLAAAIGFAITLATTGTIPRYIASFLYAPGSFSANALVYSWAVSTLSDTPEKRAACGAIVNILGHVGNIISPYFFREPERPIYRLAFILMQVFGALAFAVAFCMKLYLKRVNRKLKQLADSTGGISILLIQLERIMYVFVEDISKVHFELFKLHFTFIHSHFALHLDNLLTSSPTNVLGIAV
ncbi:Putative MFS transporter superfamily [Septoria linicola]|uniref:MFS transporter superfamily n=1 Tax=Septoria linicola TaxID=215465 RepID=A0A9Q9EL44_9PEZI|nr:putative MFS transporter superfamily [Septoria linicola]USW53043.1 Putative MFS transporter superfamily [Septoria linicola]